MTRIAHCCCGSLRAEATAFGLRRDHVLVEILATFVDRSDEAEEQRHRQ